MGGVFKDILAGKEIDKYAFSLSDYEERELIAENGDIKQYRTTFGKSASLTVYLDGRKGSAAGNELSIEGLKELAETAFVSAQASEPDPANDIAPKQPNKVFNAGCYTPDMDLLYTRFRELLDTAASDYPLVQVMLAFASHIKEHEIYVNSNGTEFEEYGDHYEAVLEFAGNDGEATTGMDVASIVLSDLETPLIECGNIRRLLSCAEEQLKPAGTAGKFSGSVIFTPECLLGFIWYLLGNYISDGVILDGTSLWLDKIGEKVVDDRINLTMKSGGPGIAVPEYYTDSGFLSEDVELIKGGVLEAMLLSLYVANKTGRPVTKNSSGIIYMDGGDESFEEMTASVEKGVIAGGFSGGQPSANGEFSGLVKNAFYVEGGKIVGALSETMISGNLEDVFKNVRGISSERVRIGDSFLPYLAADGILISGK